jgi:hypothetical protein
MTASETVEKLWSLTMTLLKSPRALRGPLWQRGRGGNPPLEKGGRGGIYQQLLNQFISRQHFLCVPPCQKKTRSIKIYRLNCVVMTASIKHLVV